jgi:hypothetical protein
VIGVLMMLVCGGVLANPAPLPKGTPPTGSPDLVNCIDGSNNISLSTCATNLSSTSAIQQYKADACAITGLQQWGWVLNQGQWSVTGWWTTTSNSYSCGHTPKLNWGGIATPSGTFNGISCTGGGSAQPVSNSGLAQGTLYMCVVTAGIQSSATWPTNLPSYVPTIAIGTTNIPSGDYDLVNSYALYQINGSEVSVEERIMLTSTSGIPTGYPSFALPVPSSTCSGMGTAMGQGPSASFDGVVQVCAGVAAIQWANGTWAYSTDFSKYSTWILRYHYFVE